jgi:hypothetical protein
LTATPVDAHYPSVQVDRRERRERSNTAAQRRGKGNAPRVILTVETRADERYTRPACHGHAAEDVLE